MLTLLTQPFQNKKSLFCCAESYICEPYQVLSFILTILLVRVLHYTAACCVSGEPALSWTLVCYFFKRFGEFRHVFRTFPHQLLDFARFRAVFLK